VLRTLQGFAVGGEWGGAVLIATESGPKDRKLRGGMFVQQGAPAGNILSTLAFTPVAFLPEEQFVSWGWRLPFLLSALLVVIGLIIRLRLEESGEFVRRAEHNRPARLPIDELLREHWRAVLGAFFACGLGISSVYFTGTLILSYATSQLGVDRHTMLNLLLANAVIQFLWQPVGTRIAERLGASRFMIGSLVISAIICLPTFAMVDTGVPAIIMAALALKTIAGSGYYAVLAGFLARAFPVRVRYTGLSFSYQSCSVIIGGGTPVLGQLLLTTGGGHWGNVAVLFLAIVSTTLGGVLALARTIRRNEASRPEPA
jgi:MFS family permease